MDGTGHRYEMRWGEISRRFQQIWRNIKQPQQHDTAHRTRERHISPSHTYTIPLVCVASFAFFLSLPVCVSTDVSSSAAASIVVARSSLPVQSPPWRHPSSCLSSCRRRVSVCAIWSIGVSAFSLIESRSKSLYYREILRLPDTTHAHNNNNKQQQETHTKG